PEPRLQIGRTGVPFFGRDVERLQPEAVVSIDGGDLGTPLESLDDIPPGDYYVQAALGGYSELRRADGPDVWLPADQLAGQQCDWMHDDQWEGQHWNRSPGTLYSAVEKVHIDPAAGGVVKLVATKSVPPVEIPPDTQYVKRFKIQSPLLTKFWGRPIYLGATV